MKHFFILVCLALIVASCSKESEKKKEEFSYDFTLNGCGTGKQTFSSKEAMCSGLMDESLNKNCAWSLRKEYHEKNCM